MATISHQVTAPGEPLTELRCALRLIVDPANPGFAYIDQTGIGGLRWGTVTTAGTVTFPDLAPTRTANGSATHPSMIPAGAVYGLTIYQMDDGYPVALAPEITFHVWDIATVQTVTSRLTDPPGTLETPPVGVLRSRVDALEVEVDSIADPTVVATAVATAVVAAEVAGLTLAGAATGPLGNVALAAGAVTTAKIATDAVTSDAVAAGAVGTAELAASAVTAAKVDSASVQVTSQKGAASGYLGLDADADATMPASTLTSALEIAGGAIRSASGLHIVQEHTQSVGPMSTTVAVGSNGVNVSTLVGAQSVQVATTGDAPTAGRFSVVTSGVIAIVAYTGKAAGAFTGCTRLSGTGTIATGAAVVVLPGLEKLFGAPVLVDYSPTVDYDAVNVLNGPRSVSTYTMSNGLTFPRSLIQIEGVVVMAVDVSEVLGMGPFGVQNNVNVINAPGTTPNIAAAIGFINAPAVTADGQALTVPPRIPGFKFPGGEQSWQLGYFDGCQSSGINGGTISDLLGVSFMSQPNYFGGSSAVIHIAYMAGEGMTADITGTVPGTGTVETQVGLVVGQTFADSALPPTKWTQATNPVGVANASTTVHPPDAQTAGAAFTVTARSTVVALSSTAARAATTVAAVIAAPTSPWYNGQVITLVNVNTTAGRTLTFTSSATTKLNLGAMTRLLGPGGTLSLVYSSTTGLWSETGYSAGSDTTATYGVLSLEDNLPVQGRVVVGPSFLGPFVGAFNNSADVAAAAVLGGGTLGLRLGPGGSTAADVILARTGADAAQLTAALTVTGQTVAAGVSTSGTNGATQAMRIVGAVTSGTPTSGVVGDVYLDRSVPSWKLCTVTGTPGTWVSLGGGGGTVDVVSNVASARILGRTTGGSGDSEELTAAQTKTLLAIVAADVSNFDTQVRTSRIDQMAAPSSSFASWADGLRVGTGTAAHGGATIGGGIFGALVTVFGDTADTQPAAVLGSLLGLRLGPGGSTAADVILARTGAAAAQLTGALTVTGQVVVPDATGATSAVNRQFGDARYKPLESGLVLLDQNGTSPIVTVNATTTATDLLSYSLAGAAFGDVYELWAVGTMVNSGTSASTTLTVLLGATTITVGATTNATSVNPKRWQIVYRFTVGDASLALQEGYTALDVTAAGAGSTTMLTTTRTSLNRASTEDLATAKTLRLTATHSTADAGITTVLRGYTLHRIR